MMMKTAIRILGTLAKNSTTIIANKHDYQDIKKNMMMTGESTSNNNHGGFQPEHVIPIAKHREPISFESPYPCITRS